MRSWSAWCAGSRWSRSRRTVRPSALPADGWSCTYGELAGRERRAASGMHLHWFTALQRSEHPAKPPHRPSCVSLVIVSSELSQSPVFLHPRRCATKYTESRLRTVVTNSKRVEKHKVGCVLQCFLVSPVCGLMPGHMGQANSPGGVGDQSRARRSCHACQPVPLPCTCLGPSARPLHCSQHAPRCRAPPLCPAS